MSVKGVILLVNGNIKDIDISFIKFKKKKELNNLDIKIELLDNIGTNNLKIIGEFEIYNSKERLIMYGFTEGHIENIHELINNESLMKLTYYGDILIINSISFIEYCLNLFISTPLSSIISITVFLDL